MNVAFPGSPSPSPPAPSAGHAVAPCSETLQHFGSGVGILSGLISSVVLVISPDFMGTAIFLEQPAILSVPIGFLGACLGTLLSKEPNPVKIRTVRPLQHRIGAGTAITLAATTQQWRAQSGAHSSIGWLPVQSAFRAVPAKLLKADRQMGHRRSPWIFRLAIQGNPAYESFQPVIRQVGSPPAFARRCDNSRPNLPPPSPSCTRNNPPPTVGRGLFQFLVSGVIKERTAGASRPLKAS